MNWPLITRSLELAMATTVGATVIGAFAALFLAGVPRRWMKLLLVLPIVALALPSFLMVNSWLDLAGPNGRLHSLLPLNLYTPAAVSGILTLMFWPIPCTAAWAAWQQLGPEHFHADMAVRGLTLVRGVLLPVARGSLLNAAALVFVLALNNFSVPAILQAKILPAEIWIRFNTLFDTAGALNLSWPLILPALALVLWISSKAWRFPHRDSVLPDGLWHRQIGRPWSTASAAVFCLLCLVSIGVPIAAIASDKRTWLELPAAWAAGQRAAFYSASFAAASAALLVAMALLVSFRGNRASFNSDARWRFLTLLSWVPFLVPGVVLGICLIWIFNRPVLSSIYSSAGIVVIAMAVRYCGPALLGIGTAVRTVDPELDDAARLDGANSQQRLFYIHWPQLAPRLFAVWYALFLLCLWDVESILLVVPPGIETLALRVFNLLHYGHNPQVNALCVMLLGLALAPLAVAGVFKAVSKSTSSKLALSVSVAALCSTMGCDKAGASRSTLTSSLFESVQVIGSRGVGVGQLNKPRSVAVDSVGSIFAVDMSGRVQKFSPSGAFLLSWQMPQTDLGKPKGMCRGSNGEIIVIEPHYQRVNHFSTEGKLLAQWGHKGTNTGEFTLPRAVAVNSHGEIYVSEYTLCERVQQFDRTGHVMMAFGNAGNGPGEFNRPEGICVDAQDRIYVADSCNHRIQIFTREGKFIRAYGKAGSGRGELSYPYDICVDSAGLQFVCEFGNSRIQVFDANDNPIEIIGKPGAAAGEFSNPWGVALDNRGNLVVADALNHRLQRFSRKITVR